MRLMISFCTLRKTNYNQKNSQPSVSNNKLLYNGFFLKLPNVKDLTSRLCFWFRCEEKEYDPNIFHNRVASYPFLDHHPPRLNLMLDFCRHVDEWCKQNDEHVAAVHCKAGKVH